MNSKGEKEQRKTGRMFGGNISLLKIREGKSKDNFFFFFFFFFFFINIVFFVKQIVRSSVRVAR